MSSVRCHPFLLAAAAALLALPSGAAALPAAHTVGTLLAPVHGDTGALPIASAGLVQTGETVGLSVKLGKGTSPLSRGATVCARIHAPGRIDWCFVRGAHGWTSTVQSKAAATVTVSGRWLSTGLPLTSIGALPGTIRWSVVSHEPSCEATTTGSCADDRLPVAGRPAARSTLWTPIATGCTGSSGKLVTNGPATAKRVAITFDDGPSEYTTKVQSILRTFGIHATFFVIGQQVAARAADLRTAIADGDEIGDHSWDHPLHALTGAELTSEIDRTQAAVRTATGFTPCLFRPPGGFLGSTTVADAGSLGLGVVTWSVDPRDWALPGTPAIIDGILSHATSGSIILDHDGGGDRSETIAALPTVIKTLQERGYQFETVSQLVGNTTTYSLQP